MNTHTATVIAPNRKTGTTFSRRLLVVALLSVMAAPAMAVQTASPRASHATARILVEPAAGLTDAALDALLAKDTERDDQGNHRLMKVKSKLSALNVRVVEVPAGRELYYAAKLARHARVKFAEVDRLVAANFVPNDPSLGSQWHLTKIESQSAWDVSTGNNITIAILDTGVDGTHPDLVGRMVPGWNSINGNATDTGDVMGHGTAVAGSAAAAGNNTQGVASVAYNAKIMPVRITNDPNGYAYFSDIAKGLTWAADNGAKVANISYTVHDSSAISSAAQYMRSKGGVVVSAAGNNSTNLTSVDNPYIITVSATDQYDGKASWSNWGKFVDVAAPGTSIYTTSRGGVYGAWSGTSFASPITAGVVGLIMSANPALKPDLVEKVLEDSAFDPTSAAYADQFGNGRVNAAAAVQLALVTVQADTQAPTNAITSPSSGSIVKGTVVVTVSAADDVGVAKVELLANGVAVGQTTTAPYTFAWNTAGLADGSVTLEARAYDAVGNVGAGTAKVTVANTVDTTKPTINVITPTNGTKVTDWTRVQVQATDNVGVVSTKLYLAGQLRAAVSGGTLDTLLNTKSLKPGKQYELRTDASDAAGNTSSSFVYIIK